MAAESCNDDIVRKLLEEQSAQYHEELRRRGAESAIQGAVPSPASDNTSRDDDDDDQNILKLCSGASPTMTTDTPSTKSVEHQEAMLVGREQDHQDKVASTNHCNHKSTPINRQESLPGAHSIIPSGTTASEPPPISSPSSPPLVIGSDDDDGDEGDESRENSRHSRSCFSALSDTRDTNPSSSDMSDWNLISASLVDMDDEASHNTSLMPQADPVDTKGKKLRQQSYRKRTNLVLILGTILVIIAGCLLLVILLVLRDDTDVEDRMPHLQQHTALNEVLSPEERVLGLLPMETVETLTDDPDSPQAMAFDWLIQDPLVLSGSYEDTRILQRFALSTIYYSLDGDNWKNNDRWLSLDHHECDWEFTNSVFFEIPALTIGLATKSPCGSGADLDDGIGDDDGGGVYTDLRLSRNGLKGKLPKQVGLLTSLKSMDISFNDELVGTLPNKAFERLSNLEAFVAVSNRHTGQIPPNLFQQISMSALAVYDNSFSGSIPSAVGALSSLKLLALGDNQLTGSLPSSVGKLSQLVTLNVERNAMTGTIPTQIGLLSTSLTDLYLRGNKEIVGNLPTQLGQLAATQIVSLGECRLTGTVPTQLGQMGEVVKLYLQDNAFSGFIPSQLGKLTAMRRLKLQDNRLSGSIPSELASLRKPHHALEHVNVRGNDLISGDIPNELCRVDGEFDGQYDCSELLCGCECQCE